MSWLQEKKMRQPDLVVIGGANTDFVMKANACAPKAWTSVMWNSSKVGLTKEVPHRTDA